MTRTGQLAPHGAARAVFELPSGPLAALDGGAGPRTVLLVPGYTGSKEDFAPAIDPLIARGYRVVAIDLPGQHESPGPDEPAGYRPHRLAQWLQELAAALGGPVHLVGHSFGGLVARAAVLAAPRHFLDLTLMSSGPAAIAGARRQRIEQLGPLLPELGVPGVWAAMEAAAATEPGYTAPEPELAAFLERRFLAGSPAMLAGMAAALVDEPDLVAPLRATRIPVLVVHGSDDDAWPPAVQRDMAHRLGARYATVPGAAHSPAAENPEATVAALTAFWTSVTPASGGTLKG